MAKKTLPVYLKAGDGFVEITLAKPMDISGSKTSVVRMREPSVADTKHAQRQTKAEGGDSADVDTNMFANLTDTTPASIDALTMRDFRRLQEAYGTFLD